MKVATFVLLAAFVAAASAAAQRSPRVHEGYSAVQHQEQPQQQHQQQQPEAAQPQEIDRQQRLNDQQLNYGDLQQGGAGGAASRFPGGRFPYLPGGGLGAGAAGPGGLPNDANINGAAGGNSRESDRRQAYYDPYSDTAYNRYQLFNNPYAYRQVLYNQGVGAQGLYGSSLLGRTAGLGGLGGYGGLGGLGGYGGLGGLGGYGGLSGYGGLGGYGLGGLSGIGGVGGLGGLGGGLGGLGGLYGGLGGLGGYGGYGSNPLYAAYGNTLYGSSLYGGLGGLYGGGLGGLGGGLYGSGGGLYSGRALYNGISGYGYKRRSQKDKKKRDDERSGESIGDLTAALDAADEPTFLDGPHGGPGFGAGPAGASLQFTGSGPIGAGAGFGGRSPFSPPSAPRGEGSPHQVRYK